MKKFLLSVSLLLGLVSALSACSGNPDTVAPSQPAGAEPASPPAKEAAAPPQMAGSVTLSFGMGATMLSDDEFKQFVTDPIKKKYPNVTINRVDSNAQGQSYAELVAAKKIPDIAANFPPELIQFTSLGIAENIDSLVKKYNFDLNRIQPEFLESEKTGGFVDYLIGIPFFNNAFGLVYNKALFDKFGVPYPKDGLTWQDASDLSVKLTREDGGIQYYGLYPDNVYRGGYQLSLNFLDTKNDKAAFQTQDWKDLFSLWAGLYKVQGITQALPYAKRFNEGQTAMSTQPTNQLANVLKLKDFDWNVSTYPVNPKAPGVGQRVASLTLIVTKQSAHKDEAFQLIAYLLSDEVQTELSRNLRMSVLKDRKIQDQFGQANADLKGKNVVAYTKLKMAILQPFKFDFKTNPATQINNEFNKVIYEGKDINTALRDADETMTQELQSVKSQ
jgi:multiple sugar transport system substrate-binding protein